MSLVYFDFIAKSSSDRLKLRYNTQYYTQPDHMMSIRGGDSFVLINFYFQLAKCQDNEIYNNKEFLCIDVNCDQAVYIRPCIIL